MRKRAEASMKQAEAANSAQASIYDYDGNYDSFHPPKEDSSGEKQKEDKKKESRYIGDLLKASKERNFDRDIAYERKMARDLEKEEAENPSLNDTKFVTAAYKQKLEERKLWKQAQDEKDQQEGAASTTKDGMASFYGNLTHNVAMGGTRPSSASVNDDGGESSATANASAALKSASSPPPSTTSQEQQQHGSFVDGFEAAAAPSAPSTKSPTPPNPEQVRRERYELRKQKLAQARERYWARHPERRQPQRSSTSAPMTAS